MMCSLTLCSFLVLVGLRDTHMLCSTEFFSSIRISNDKNSLLLWVDLLYRAISQLFQNAQYSVVQCAWLCCCCSWLDYEYPAISYEYPVISYKYPPHILREKSIGIIVEVLVDWDLSRSSSPTSFSKHEHQISHGFSQLWTWDLKATCCSLQAMLEACYWPAPNPPCSSWSRGWRWMMLSGWSLTSATQKQEVSSLTLLPVLPLL